MRLTTRPEDIPTTSVAEFRVAARQVYGYHRPGAVAVGSYLTWVGAGFALAILAIGVAGLAVTPESWWIVLVGVAAVALSAWWIRRLFRRAADVRARLVEQSREVDARAARGDIPMTPPGWQGDVPPALHE